ncbi:MAG: hypothetical protein CFE31_17515 [Rhizobiales bacterium PAR1]|nr:MAG: hypothetical protein CFE31_17515 [Rhizobiales bacterium PAR1]
MTSISSNNQSVHHRSPLSRLQQALASEVTSGKVKSADQTALAAALESIDSSMQSSMASGTRPSPEEGKSKVQSLIDDMVSNGSLTSDQASELKTVFEDTFAGGPGGAKGKMGPPPPPPSDDSDSDETSGNFTLTLSGSNSDILSLLQDLMKSLASTGTTSYSQSATANTNISSLFLDKSA